METFFTAGKNDGAEDGARLLPQGGTNPEGYEGLKGQGRIYTHDYLDGDFFYCR